MIHVGVLSPVTGGFFYGWGWLHARAMPANEAGRILGTRLHELPSRNRTRAITPHSG